MLKGPSRKHCKGTIRLESLSMPLLPVRLCNSLPFWPGTLPRPSDLCTHANLSSCRLCLKVIQTSESKRDIFKPSLPHRIPQFLMNFIVRFGQPSTYHVLPLPNSRFCFGAKPDPNGDPHQDRLVPASRPCDCPSASLQGKPEIAWLQAGENCLGTLQPFPSDTGLGPVQSDQALISGRKLKAL